MSDERPEVALSVDGAPVATSAADLEAGDAAAVDGLTITWGRSSRLDQPSASTMRAALAVPESVSPAVLDRLVPGRRITATTTIPRREAPALRVHTMGAWEPTGASPVADFPPAPLQDDGSSPHAWDGVPAASPATVTSLTLSFERAPAPTALAVAPLYYTGPWSTNATAGPAITVPVPAPGPVTITTRPGTPASIPLDPRFAGRWVGFRVTATRSGPTWADLGGPWSGEARPWAALGLRADQATVLTDSSQARTQLVFSGRIAAAPVTWDARLRCPRVDLTCNDWTADLENRKIGDEPWPAEPTRSRLARVLAAARPGLNAEPLSEATASRVLASRDVDAQPPMDLLREIAVSNDAILWAVAHQVRGEYVKIEDNQSRVAFYRLTWGPDGNARIDAPTDRPGASLYIPANTIRRDGVSVERDLSDLATVVRVTYKTTSEDGKQEDADTTATAPDREAEYGIREISASTWLDRREDALSLANAIINRAGPGGWSITGAVIDSRHRAVLTDTLATLLDAASRPGLALTLAGLPQWVPGAPRAPVYLDGGTYTYTGRHWELALTLTRAATSGGAVTWAQVPANKNWTNLASLTFADLASLTVK